MKELWVRYSYGHSRVDKRTKAAAWHKLGTFCTMYALSKAIAEALKDKRIGNLDNIEIR